VRAGSVLVLVYRFSCGFPPAHRAASRRSYYQPAATVAPIIMRALEPEARSAFGPSSFGTHRAEDCDVRARLAG
jgi:hypothetical protein